MTILNVCYLLVNAWTDSKKRVVDVRYTILYFIAAGAILLYKKESFLWFGVVPGLLLLLLAGLSRSIIIPIRHHRRSVCKTDFDCKCLSLDYICDTRNCVIRVIANVQSLQIRIGRSIYSVLAHPIVGSSIPESICLLSILQRRYLPCFLCVRWLYFQALSAC